SLRNPFINNPSVNGSALFLFLIDFPILGTPELPGLAINGFLNIFKAAPYLQRIIGAIDCSGPLGLAKIREDLLAVLGVLAGHDRVQGVVELGFPPESLTAEGDALVIVA